MIYLFVAVRLWFVHTAESKVKKVLLLSARDLPPECFQGGESRAFFPRDNNVGAAEGRVHRRRRHHSN